MMRISARLKGMGIGGLFLALFGGLWMLAALDASSLIWIVTCVLLPTSLLVVWAIGLLLASAQARTLEPPPRPEEQVQARRIGRRFGIVFMIEFALIALAANVLGALGRMDWLMFAIALIVGVHFLPLARIFDYRLYYWTGGVEIGVALLIAALLRHHLAAADPLFGLAMAMSLWITVIVVLLHGRRLAAAVRAAAPATPA
jgi:hypothetical protein